MKLKEFIKQHENDEIELKEDGTLKILENKVKLEKFVPKDGEYFYYIDNHNHVILTQKVDEQDEYLINHTLVFKTQGEARDYRYFLDKLDEYSYKFSHEEWNDFETMKHYIIYDVLRKRLNVICTCSCEYETTYFIDEYMANEFINDVGEERIKAYMFDIWE